MLVCTPQDTAYLVDLLSIDQLAPAALQHGELVVHWFHRRGSFRQEDYRSSFCAINSDQSGGSIRAHIHRAASQRWPPRVDREPDGSKHVGKEKARFCRSWPSSP